MAFLLIKQYVFITVLYQESHKLTEYIENEITGRGNKNFGESQYCFQKELKRETFIQFLMVLGQFHVKMSICSKVLRIEISFLKLLSKWFLHIR
jgi:hypothetical protein